jgi:hypothetical protein
MLVILEIILQYHEGKLVDEQMIKIAEAMYGDNPDRLQQELPAIEKCSNTSKRHALFVTISRTESKCIFQI